MPPSRPPPFCATIGATAAYSSPRARACGQAKGQAAMRVGVGLPSTVPGARADLLREWARRADAGPFASLAVLDRVVYDSFDPLLALAAVAPLTSRIRLPTNVLIGPLRSTAQLAKSTASLHALSDGRLTLGLAIGARPEDYAPAEVDPATRGKRLVRPLAALRETWEAPRPA